MPNPNPASPDADLSPDTVSIRSRKRFRLGKGKGVLFILLLMVIWELLVVGKVIDMVSFPRMSAILATFVRVIFNGEILSELGPSLLRMLVGYLLAVLVGVAIGVAMGHFSFLYDLLEPLTELLRPIPSPAYIPIAILFLGVGENMKIFTIFFGTMFPILLNTYSGVRNVDRVQIDTARTFGLGTGAMIWEVIIPAASPYILTGMRVSAAISLILVVISEMVASNSGIGYYILDMQRSFHITEMYAGVMTLAGLGYLLNWFFLKLERNLIGWNVAQRPRG